MAPARDLALAVAFGLIAVLGWGLVYGLIVRGRAKERALKSADRESQRLIAVYAPIREGLTALAFGVLSLALSLAVAHRRGIPGSWEEQPGVESTLSFGLLLAVAASLIGGVICAIHFFASVEEVGLSPAPEIPVVRPSGIGFWLPYVLSGALAIQLIEGSVEDDAQTVFAISEAAM